MHIEKDGKHVLDTRVIDGIGYWEIIHFDEEPYPGCKIFCNGVEVEDEILWINVITGEYECVAKRPGIIGNTTNGAAFFNHSKQKIETEYKTLDPTALKFEWEGGIEAYRQFQRGYLDWVVAMTKWQNMKPELIAGKVVWPAKETENAS